MVVPLFCLLMMAKQKFSIYIVYEANDPRKSIKFNVFMSDKAPKHRHKTQYLLAKFKNLRVKLCTSQNSDFFPPNFR